MPGALQILDDLLLAMTNDSALRAVGASVYIGDLPDSLSYPVIRMYPTGGQVVTTLNGESDLKNATWAVDTFAKTMVQAMTIGERARQVLQSQLGAVLASAPFAQSDSELHVQRYSFQASLWA